MARPGELNLIYLGCSAPQGAEFTPAEHPYPGNQAHLLNFLERVIRAKAPRLASLADLFSGGGAVAAHFAGAGVTVTANDLRQACYVTTSAHLLATPETVDRAKLREITSYLAALPGREGALAQRCLAFMPEEAAHKVQAYAGAVQALAKSGRLTAQEERMLVAGLIYAVDRLVGTGPGGAARMVFRLPRAAGAGPHQVFCQDARQLAATVEAEAVYLDPPRGPEKAAGHMALLEEIAGPAGEPAGLGDWTEPERAAAALADLVSKVRGRHLFLSYGSDGVIPNAQIWSILKTRGRPECFEQEHGAAGGRVTERLFYCELQN